MSRVSLALRMAPWLLQRGVHYGWVVAVTTFLTMLATAAAMDLHTYMPALQLAGALCMMAALVVLVLRKPREPRGSDLRI